MKRVAFIVAFLLLPAPATADALGAPVAVRKGEPPRSAEYWKHLDWYQSHAIVSVLLNGADREGFLQTLAKLSILREKGVPVARVTVIGRDLISEIERGGRVADPRERRIDVSTDGRAIRPTDVGVLARRLGLHGGRTTNVADTLERLGVKNSPTWIVRYRGQDYLYEGDVSLRTMFNGDGTFRVPNDADPVTARAKVSFESDAAPVAFRTRRSSTFSLRSEPRLNANDERALKRVSKEHFGQLETFAIEYPIDLYALPPGAGTSDALPACERSTVRIEPVLLDSSELRWFDLLVYDYRAPEDERRARAWPRPSAPYLEGDLTNPYRASEPQQEFIRLFDVQCLPTRFRYVTAEGRSVLEYREGARAWDE